MTATNTSEREEIEATELEFHRGRMALHFSTMDTNAYNVVLGQVANSIDAKATRIVVIITPANSGRVDCYDNGNGMTLEKAKWDWKHAAESSKGVDELGERGDDKMKSFFLCKKVCWTSRPLIGGDRRFFTIEISKEELESNPRPKFPTFIEKEGFTFGDIVPFQPTTRIMCTSISKEVLSDLENLGELAELIGSACNEKILSLHADIQIIFRPEGINRTTNEKRVTVVPREFAGLKMDPENVTTPFGDVRFSLFSSHDAAKTPHLLVRPPKGQRFELKNLRLSQEGTRVLMSGHFAGEIGCDFITPTSNRRNCESGPEKDELIKAINLFAEKRLAGYLEHLAEPNRIKRITESLRKAVQLAEEYIGNNPNIRLKLKGKLAGFVSDSHVDTDKSPETEIPLRKKPLTLRDYESQERIKKQTPKTPGQERKGVIHSGVRDLEGKKRRIKGNQFGLTVDYKEAPIERIREICWVEGGIIIFNTTHKYFTEASNKDRSGRALDKFVQRHLHKIIASLQQDNERDAKLFVHVYDTCYEPFPHP